MKRLLVLSAALALVGAAAPINGSGGATPADRIDVMVKLPGDRHWTGKDLYGAYQKKHIVLRHTGSKVVAQVRFVNTGTETTYFDFHVGHPYPGFDDSDTVWPDGISQLEPGQAVTIRYVTRLTAEADPGDRSDVSFAIPYGSGESDGVLLMYRAAR
jgi:hypothetical protein